jgi:uroporphyrinogen-III synthase
MSVSPVPAPPARLVITRPQPQADAWVRALRALDVPAEALPLLEIGPPADAGAAIARAWAALDAPRLRQGGARDASGGGADAGPGPDDADTGVELDAVPDTDTAPDAAPPRLLMFVSPAAVDRFFSAGRGGAQPSAHRWPAGVLAGSTGPGTERALREAGVPVAQIISPAPDAPRLDSEVLWTLLRPLGGWAGATSWIVRGEDGRDWLADTLRAEGGQVRFIAAYRRRPPQADAALRQRLQDLADAAARSTWVFSSSEAAGHLRTLAPAADWSAAAALASHPRIAEAARALGFGRVRLVRPDPQAVAEAWRQL